MDVPPLPSAPAPRTSRPELIVIGGSVRFLAASCRRAGWSVHACDRFGDADLLAIACSYLRLPTCLSAAAPLLAPLAQLPLLFTGGLENAPDLLRSLAKNTRTASASGEVVEAVRDVTNLAAAATAAGLTFPETHLSPTGLPTDGSYLIKPCASVGGHAIAPWLGDRSPDTPSLWQRHVHGTPHGVNVLLNSTQPPVLLGVSRSLHRREATAAPGWAYAGSVSVPAAAWTAPVLTLAGLLAKRHGLRGAVGIDCILEPTGTAAVLEINPRPTASMELVERTRGVCIAAEHLAAFGIRSPCEARPAARTLPVASGKAILYAEAPIAVTADILAQLAAVAARWHHHDACPAIADIPHAGSQIDTGHPVLTLFADGRTSEAVDDLLASRLDDLRRLLR